MASKTNVPGTFDWSPHDEKLGEKFREINRKFKRRDNDQGDDRMTLNTWLTITKPFRPDQSNNNMLCLLFVETFRIFGESKESGTLGYEEFKISLRKLSEVTVSQGWMQSLSRKNSIKENTKKIKWLENIVYSLIRNPVREVLAFEKIPNKQKEIGIVPEHLDEIVTELAEQALAMLTPVTIATKIGSLICDYVKSELRQIVPLVSKGDISDKHKFVFLLFIATDNLLLTWRCSDEDIIDTANELKKILNKESDHHRISYKEKKRKLRKWLEKYQSLLVKKLGNKALPPEVVDIPEKEIPRMKGVDDVHTNGIQPYEGGASPPLQAADFGAVDGAPASYTLPSLQRTPDGPIVQMPGTSRNNSPPGGRAQTPNGIQPSAVVSDTNSADDRPASDGRGEPDQVIPSAPPQSLPPNENIRPSSTVPATGTNSHPPNGNQTPTTRALSAAQVQSTNSQPSSGDQTPTVTPAAATGTRTNSQPPNGNQIVTPIAQGGGRPHTRTSVTTESNLVLKEGVIIVDVLQWVSDNFGSAGFSNFSRSLPGVQRLTGTDIQAAEYELPRHHTLSERNMAILEYWKERNPDDCTGQTMYNMLRKSGRNDLAKRLMDEFCASGECSTPSTQVVHVPAMAPRQVHDAQIMGSQLSGGGDALQQQGTTTGQQATATGQQANNGATGFVQSVDNLPESDFLILHEPEDRTVVDTLRKTMMRKLNGARVAILHDFHAEWIAPRPLEAGLKKSSVVFHFISENTKKKDRKDSMFSDLNFKLLADSKKRVFIIYDTSGASCENVAQLVINDTPYLKLLADVTSPYDVNATDFYYKMNDIYRRYRPNTQARIQSNNASSS